jgi:acyl-CoA thioesterase
LDGGPITGPHRITMDGWISCAPFERLLHMNIVEASEGRAVLTMPFLADFAQGGGLMHGGALVSLADTAVVMAIKSIIAPQSHFATTFLTTKFLSPVRQGVVTAKANVLSMKGRIIEGEATVFDDAETQVLAFSSTFKIAKTSKIGNVVFKAG